MLLTEIIILATIQGITEFLPISSSAHLKIITHITSLTNDGIINNIAMHFGSLAAILIYLRKDIFKLFIGINDIFLNKKTHNRKIFLLLELSLIPVFIVGYILKKTNTIYYLYSLEIIIWANTIFSIFLYIFDKISKKNRSIKDLNIKDAILIGLAQVFALIPGTSRSGVTITMARLLGINLNEAIRFSMLMSIQTILGATILLLIDFNSKINIIFYYDIILLIFLSFIISLFSIYSLIKIIKYINMTPFVIYRLVLSGLLIYHFIIK